MSPTSNYTWDHTEETRKIDQRGEVHTYYRVFAYTAKKTYFHIEVADTDLAKAPELLAKKAAVLDSI